MGESYDAKILSWKQEVESRELSKKLLSSKGFEKCVTLLEEKSAFLSRAAAEDINEILATENSKDRKTYR